MNAWAMCEIDTRSNASGSCPLSKMSRSARSKSWRKVWKISALGRLLYQKTKWSTFWEFVRNLRLLRLVRVPALAHLGQGVEC